MRSTTTEAKGQFDFKGNLRDWWTPEDAKGLKTGSTAFAISMQGM